VAGLLVNLLVIDVHNNLLTELPPELCALPKLARVLAGGNKLASLPDNVGCLGKQLKMLSLR